MTIEYFFVLLAFAAMIALCGKLLRSGTKSAVESALSTKPKPLEDTSLKIGYEATGGSVEEMQVRILRAYRKDGLVFFHAKTPGTTEERTFSVHNVAWVKDELTNDSAEGAAAREWFKVRVP